MGEDASPPDWVVVGRVRRPVGLKGELIVDPTGDDPGRFRAGTRLRARTERDGDRDVTVLASRSYKDGGFAVLFGGIDSVDRAEEMRGALLEIQALDLPPLPEGVFYHYQIEGLEVVDSAGEAIGRVQSILSAGSNDVYCVGSGSGEVLIPAIRDYVARVDLAAGRIILSVTRDRLGADEPPI